jgi:hypothetical protein
VYPIFRLAVLALLRLFVICVYAAKAQRVSHMLVEHAVVSSHCQNSISACAKKRISNVKLMEIAETDGHKSPIRHQTSVDKRSTEAAMTPGYIFIVHPDGRQQAIPMRAGLLRIGSAPDNDLVLAGIAAHHATIRCDDEGDLLITIGGCDMRSSAATMEIELPRVFATALLTRIGGYALRYQPAALPSYQQSHAAAPLDDAATLLHALLDQRIVWADAQPGQTEPHEAITIEMQALRRLPRGE